MAKKKKLRDQLVSWTKVSGLSCQVGWTKVPSLSCQVGWPKVPSLSCQVGRTKVSGLSCQVGWTKVPGLSCQCYIAQTSPLPKPHPLMRKNGLANQVKFLGLVCDQYHTHTTCPLKKCQETRAREVIWQKYNLVGFLSHLGYRLKTFDLVYHIISYREAHMVWAQDWQWPLSGNHPWVALEQQPPVLNIPDERPPECRTKHPCTGSYSAS